MKKLLSILLCLVIVCAFSGCSLTPISPTSPIEHIKPKEFMKESTSPDGAYTVKAYLDSGNATVDFAVLCTVTENATGETRNIYWNYHCNKAKIKWTDNETVVINGETLNVKTDIYSWGEEN